MEKEQTWGFLTLPAGHPLGIHGHASLIDSLRAHTPPRVHRGCGWAGDT